MSKNLQKVNFMPSINVEKILISVICEKALFEQKQHPIRSRVNMP